jgi:hypothetical protein
MKAQKRYMSRLNEAVKEAYLAHPIHVEDEVELADVLKAAVEGLDEDLDEVEDAQLALGVIHAEDEVQRGVVPDHARGGVKFNKESAFACVVWLDLGQIAGDYRRRGRQREPAKMRENVREMREKMQRTEAR